MSQNLQNFVKFQKFQLENLVDFEKCCRTHIYLQKSEPIQPKTSNVLPKFCQPTLSIAGSGRTDLPGPRAGNSRSGPGLAHRRPDQETIPYLGWRSLIFFLPDLATILKCFDSMWKFFGNLLTFGNYLEFPAIPTGLCEHLSEKQNFLSEN